MNQPLKVYMLSQVQILIFFLLLTNSKEKNYETHVALSKDVMLYVIEGFLQ
jgi:hypothetical protein